MVWATRFADKATRPDTTAGSVGNRWQDAVGVWSIGGGRFLSPSNGPNSYSDNPLPALLRPASETPNADVRTVVVVKANSTQNLGTVLHKVAGTTPTYVLTLPDFTPGAERVIAYTISNGSPSLVSASNWTTSAIPGEDYSVDTQISSNAISVTITRVSTGATVATTSGTLSAVTAAGACGLLCWEGVATGYPDDGTPRSFGSFSSFNQVASSSGSVVISPTSFPVGMATPFTLTGTSTSWTSATVATLLGGGSGASMQLTGMRISGQVISGFLNPGSSSGATLTIGNSTDQLTATASSTLGVIGKVTFDGDSLTAGQYTTGEGTINATRVAVTMKGIGPAYAGQNIGVSGQTISQMQGRISAYITPFYDSSKQNYLIAVGGHNDINAEAGSQPNTQAGADAVLSTVKSRIQSYVAAVLSACPAMKIVWCTLPPASNASYPPYFDYVRDEVNKWMRLNFSSMGIAALGDVAADSTIGQAGSEFDPRFYNSDLTHPIDAGAAIWGQYDFGALRTLLPTPGASAKTVALTLTSDGSTPRANLSGLKWAFFDQPVVGSFVPPTSSGAAGATDASGNFSVQVLTVLAAGASGWLTVTDSDGTVSQSPPSKAFSGPVVVS